MENICIFLYRIEKAVASATERWFGPVLAFGAILVTSAASVVQIFVLIYLLWELGCGAEVVDFKVVLSAKLGLMTCAVGAVGQEIPAQVGPVLLIIREFRNLFRTAELHSSVSEGPE